jgi:hypothetical protein
VEAISPSTLLQLELVGGSQLQSLVLIRFWLEFVSPCGNSNLGLVLLSYCIKRGPLGSLCVVILCKKPLPVYIVIILLFVQLGIKFETLEIKLVHAWFMVPCWGNIIQFLCMLIDWI